MRTVKLTRSGFCGNCEIWLEMKDSSGGLPTHNMKGGQEKCTSSGYSPLGCRYVIKTRKEALEVAGFLQNDTGYCLVRDRHSIACGDGDRCNAERRMLAEALSTYCLENFLPN